MRRLPLVALALALLVVSIPVALAQELRVIRFSGTDRVNGYGRPDDTLTVVVEASIPGEDTISPGQLKLLAEDYEVPFGNCAPTAVAGLYNCTYSETYADAYGTEEYTIELRNDDGGLAKSVPASLTIDLIPPDIIQYTVEPEQAADGRFTARVIAEDYGSQPGITEQCSGVKEIRLTVGGAQQAAAAGEPGNCRVERIIDFTRATEGRAELCATATDYLGQVSAPTCRTIIVDRSPPDIHSLDLRGQPGDFRLTFLRTGEPREADISVVIDDVSGVQPGSVSASLPLSPETGERGPDDIIGDTYVWRGIPVTDPGNCHVSVMATDALGNTANRDLTCTIGVDDTGPAIQDITAAGEYEDGTPVFGTGGHIKVLFTEAGIGMSRADAKLDMTSLGLGLQTADRCVKEGGSWACYWDDLRPSASAAGSREVTVAEARDDLGNPLTEPKSESILFDPNAPVILGFVGLRIFHNTAEFGNFTVNGDGIEVGIQVMNADSSSADFTQIGGSNATPGSCVAAGDNASVQNCTFGAIIQASGPAEVTTYYTFRDIAGNSVSTTFTFFIYEVLDDDEPDYWRSDVSCTPALIDRKVTALLEHRVYCRVHLTKKSLAMNVSVANALPGELTECTGAVSGNLADLGAINTRAGTTDPFLVLTLSASDFRVNDLNINCPVKLFSRVGGRLARGVETEQANITLRFYDQPLGELNANVDEEINDAVDRAQKTLKWVGTLQKFMVLAEKVCGIKSLLTSILTTLDTLTLALGINAQILLSNPYTHGQGRVIDRLRHGVCGGPKTYTEGTLTTIFNFLDQFCGFINCAPAEPAKEALSFEAISGGVPWCKDVQKFFSTGGLISDYEAGIIQQGAYGYNPAAMNVKESIVLSAACLCVPGIIYNLNKYRQIVCQGALCKVQLKDTGVPLSYCKEIESYMLCQWVVGEIFSILPFAGLYNQIVNILKEIWSNPIAAVALVSGLLCKELCTVPADALGHTKYYACSAVKLISKIGDAIASFKGIKREGYWQVEDEFCAQLEEAMEE